MTLPRRLLLNFDLLRYAEGVVYLDPEVANCAVEFRVPKDQLYSGAVAFLGSDAAS